MKPIQILEEEPWPRSNSVRLVSGNGWEDEDVERYGVSASGRIITPKQFERPQPLNASGNTNALIEFWRRDKVAFLTTILAIGFFLISVVDKGAFRLDVLIAVLCFLAAGFAYLFMRRA